VHSLRIMQVDPQSATDPASAWASEKRLPSAYPFAREGRAVDVPPIVTARRRGELLPHKRPGSRDDRLPIQQLLGAMGPLAARQIAASCSRSGRPELGIGLVLTVMV
jgi:hypothetical protein